MLTKDHDLPSFLTPLTVRGKNARRGGSHVSYLHEVYVDVYGVSIRMLQKKKLLVRRFVLNVAYMYAVKLHIKFHALLQ